MFKGILDQIRSSNLRRYQAERTRRRSCAVGPARTSWGRLGVRGVYAVPSGRFEAKLRVAGRIVRLGTFDTIAEAAAAVQAREARP